MANEEHLGIIKQGVGTWNAWREAHPDLVPDLSHSNLGGAHLTYEQYWPADLPSSAWQEPILPNPELQGINLSRAKIDGAYFGQAQLQDANFRGAEGIGADFREADLQGADFSSAAIQASNFWGANIRDAAFEGYANFYGCSFSNADLRGSRLRQAGLSSVSFVHSNLQHADLRESRLEGAVFTSADLKYADLSGADLRLASLVETNLEESNLRGAKIYGISAWGLHLNGAEQSDLVITPQDEARITVDELEVAQFIYLLLHNEKVRHVIDTITSKVVLILGRFTPERKPVLDAIREVLGREHDYVPIVFDFDKPATRDTQETISLLARMARFIIADITDARSIPQELGDIVPDLPSVPVQPLLQEGAEPWGMFDRIRRYPWVLPIERYGALEQLLPRLRERVIAPAEEKLAEIRGQT